MLPLRKPVLAAFKKTLAWSMYLVPPQKSEVLQGRGCVRELPARIRVKGLRKPLVVTDRVLLSLGVPGALFRAFEREGVPFASYDGVQPDPTVENVEEALSLYRHSGCDCVVGLGGGSVMDTAKVMAARAARPRRSTEKLGGYFTVMRPFPKRLPRIFCVPTTAGTGAETTSAAVVTDVRRNVKYTVNDFLIHPHFIVLDPELTTGLPPFVTAVTAMDALAHAVEGYIGGAHCAMTDRLSEEAVKSIFVNIDRAYRDGADVEARAAMLHASYCAGVVLNRALTGYAHPFAHKIGGLYHLPHGRVIGAVMPHVFEFYGAAAHRRLARLAAIIGAVPPGEDQARGAAAFIEALRAYDRRYGIGETIPELREEDFPEIARSIHRECVPYPVPRIMDDRDVTAILKKLKG